MPEYITKNEPVDKKPYIVYTEEKNILYSDDLVADDPFAPENRELLYDDVHLFEGITTTAATLITIPVSSKYYNRNYVIVLDAERVDKNDLNNKGIRFVTAYINIYAANEQYSSQIDGSHRGGFGINHSETEWASSSNASYGITLSVKYDSANPDVIELLIGGRQSGYYVLDGEWRIRIFAIKHNVFE